jgi:hypothetical protein
MKRILDLGFVTLVIAALWIAVVSDARNVIARR